MRIVITGASGFIGQNLISALSKKHEIVALSRSIPKIDAKYTHISCDLSGNNNFYTLIDGNVDAIIHLAQSEKYRTLPATANDLFAVNVNSAQNLLDFAYKKNINWFNYASSGSVYEPYLKKNLNEDTPITTNNMYAVSKYMAERLVLSYGNTIKTSNFRLFFPYGEGQKDKLFSNILNRVQSKTPIDIQSKFGMVFTPTHIDDIILVYKESLNQQWEGTYNIAPSHKTSLKMMAQIIGEKLNIKPVYNYKEGIAPKIVPNTNKLNQIYFNQFQTLEEGLRFLKKNDI